MTLQLFPDQYEDFSLPELKEGPMDQAFDEIELLGFPLSSPFDLIANPEKYLNHEYVLATELDRHKKNVVKILGCYVCRKDVRTVRRERMSFGTWLDREGRFFDTVHFPNFLKRHPFRGKGIYALKGKVVEDFGVLSIEVLRMERLPFMEDERYL